MFQSVDGEEELNEEEVRHHGPIETLGTPIAGRGHASLRTNLDTRHSNCGAWARITADQFRHSALRTFTKHRAFTDNYTLQGSIEHLLVYYPKKHRAFANILSKEAQGIH